MNMVMLENAGLLINKHVQKLEEEVNEMLGAIISQLITFQVDFTSIAMTTILANFYAAIGWSWIAL